jgi:hypothetical protein
MQTPIKLAGAALLVVATTSFAQLTQQDIDLIRLALDLNRSDPKVDQRVFQPQLEPIYQAYPNNPQLYRYLERNPRYIDYYLGK